MDEVAISLRSINGDFQIPDLKSADIVQVASNRFVNSVINSDRVMPLDSVPFIFNYPRDLV